VDNLILQGYHKGEGLRNWTLEELLIIAIVIIIYFYFRFIRK